MLQRSVWIICAALATVSAQANSPICPASIEPIRSSIEYTPDFSRIGRENVPAYDALFDPSVSPLRPGDRLALPHRQVTFHGWLGAGNTTRILDIGDRALRVPKRSGYFYQESESTLFIRAFLDGYHALDGSDIPRVHVYEEESEPPFYLTVEKLEVFFNLEDYFAGTAGTRGLSKDLIDAEIEKFLAKSWAYSRIPDYSPKQICWTNRGLLLMDFYVDQSMFYVEKATHVDSRSIFDSWKSRKASKAWSNLSESYRHRLENALARRRRSGGLVLTTEDPVWAAEKEASDAAMRLEFSPR